MQNVFFVFLISGATISVCFDLYFVIRFFPTAFSNYDMFLFDNETYKQDFNLYRSLLDIMSHFGIANMINHSIVFLFFIFLWRKSTSYVALSILAIYFIMTLFSKMFFLTIVFGNQEFKYLPLISVALVGAGLAGKGVLIFKQRRIKI